MTQTHTSNNTTREQDKTREQQIIRQIKLKKKRCRKQLTDYSFCGTMEMATFCKRTDVCLLFCLTVCFLFSFGIKWQQIKIADCRASKRREKRRVCGDRIKPRGRAKQKGTEKRENKRVNNLLKRMQKIVDIVLLMWYTGEGEGGGVRELVSPD